MYMEKFITIGLSFVAIGVSLLSVYWTIEANKRWKNAAGIWKETAERWEKVATERVESDRPIQPQEKAIGDSSATDEAKEDR